jgi:acetyl esterase/lipase
LTGLYCKACSGTGRASPGAGGAPEVTVFASGPGEPYCSYDDCDADWVWQERHGERFCEQHVEQVGKLRAELDAAATLASQRGQWLHEALTRCSIMHAERDAARAEQALMLRRAQAAEDSVERLVKECLEHASQS